MSNNNSNIDQTQKSYFPGYQYAVSLMKDVLTYTLNTSNNIPKHVGFIMDGNRRFARKSGMPVSDGHEAGFFSMSRVLELCYASGVDTCTVYAFSIENFKRSASEVDALMKLAHQRIRQLCEHGELAHKYGVRVRVIGDLSLLDQDLLEEIAETTKLTQHNSRATLNICFPYTGREEILHSMKETIEECNSTGDMKRRKITISDIDETVLDSNLYTGKLPPLDLMIRTSGICRFSDFMIWQVCNRGTHVELVDCLWPEFGPVRMAWILLKFAYSKNFSTEQRDSEDEDGTPNEMVSEESEETAQQPRQIRTSSKKQEQSKNNSSTNGIRKEKLQ